MKAKRIEDIINTFNPQQALDPKEKETWEFYVDTGRTDLLKIKQQFLASNSRLKLLLGGHPGNGKSTELNKLAIDNGLQEKFFIIHYSIKDYLDFRDIELTDVLLSIGFLAYQEGVDAGVKISSQLKEKLTEYQKIFLGIMEREKEQSKTCSSELNTEAEAGAASHIPFLSLGIKLLARLKQQAETRNLVREYFKPRLTDLLDLINAIIQGLEESLLKEKSDRQVLLIVDDLDKLLVESALRLYYDHGSNLAYLKCNAIMTLPISVCYSPKIGIIESTIGKCYSLANIRLLNREGKEDPKSEKGFALMRAIITSRAEVDLLEPAAMEEAIRYSGGVFRQMLELIRSGAIESASRSGKKITTSDIISAVAEKRNALKRPLTHEYLDLLLEVRRTRMIICDDETKRLELLHGLFALQYMNGEEWCQVNPVLESFLDDYQKIRPPAVSSKDGR